jgi:hypothetical protein
LFISALWLVAGCNNTGVLVHIEPKAGTTPTMQINVARPDGTVRNDPYTALMGNTDHKRDVLIYVSDDNIPEIAVQFQVTLMTDQTYCQQSAVKLVHGQTVELTIAPDTCSSTLTAKCPTCGDLTMCADTFCKPFQCKPTGKCEDQQYCDGCGNTVPFCCPMGMTCVNVVDGFGNECK